MDTIILYECDGMDDSCAKTHCFMNEGPCHHTTQIEHAKNFHPCEDVIREITHYVENEVWPSCK